MLKPHIEAPAPAVDTLKDETQTAEPTVPVWNWIISAPVQSINLKDTMARACCRPKIVDTHCPKSG